MLDLGISKMALIGAVALIVIGPEKLPRVARTVGTLLGKAQRYVSDVKAEVNRAMDLDELKKMKESVEEAGREVEKAFTPPRPISRRTGAASPPDWMAAARPATARRPGSRRRPNTAAPTRTGASSAAPRRSGRRRATACGDGCCRALPV